jgi:putative tryptophan/tyrosine transport system substrate-binding protein
MSVFPLPRLIAGLAALFLALLSFASLAGVPTENRPSITWFKYGDDVLNAWAIVEMPGDPMRVSIRPRFNSMPSRRILVVYPRPSSAYDVAITKILQVFAEKDIDAEFTVVNFNNEDSRGNAVLALAESDQYSLIFAMGSESTAWLYNRYRGGRIPVVSVCSKDPVELGQIKDYESGSGTNFAFTSLNMQLDAQMAYIRELRPSLRNFAILVDSKNVSAMQTQAAPMAKLARQLGIQVLEVAVNDPTKARAELDTLIPAAVRTMKKNDPTLANSVFWVTGSTAVFKEIAAINAHADRVPVVSAVPEIVKAGDESAVISIGISFESNAHLAAVYGADVLLGRARVGDLKVGIVSPPDIAINFRKAREIGFTVPFSFFERATYIYDYEGRAVRSVGRAPNTGG